MRDLSTAGRRVNAWMQEQGARFFVTRKGDRQFADAPFDPTPRILPGAEFTMLEQGLIQRINALNQFLCDIYKNRMIIRDGIVPEEFVFSSPDFAPEVMNLTPVKQIAACLGLSESKVKSMLFRLRGRLRGQLEKEGWL